MAENIQPLGIDLVSKLRLEILTEQIRPGEKLTESILCKRYGISRTPVREALKHLETERLVRIIPNRGAFALGLSHNDIKDLYTLRMQNETLAVRWAIERRTQEEMEAIEESFDFMMYYTKRDDVHHMRSINARFHRQISEASHNRILIDSLSRIYDYIRYSSRVSPSRESDLATILFEHKSIFESLVTGDISAGEAAMKTHIENSFKRSSL